MDEIWQHPASTLPAGQSNSLPQRERSRRRACRATSILHMISTQPFASPFDVNMAVDAGYKVIVPHINIRLEQTAGLVQDAIFSRPPDYGCRTGLFIGGKDALQALDMLAAAKDALVPPFQLSAFADPGGSFTTAAAMVASVEHVFKHKLGRELADARVAVFGATGVVGFLSAVIAAMQGAKVQAVTHMGLETIVPLVAEARSRFGVELEPVLCGRDSGKPRILKGADIVLCAAAAGVRVLSLKQIASVRREMVVADVNAVPPSGIEGVGLFANGTPMEAGRALAVGPLAIGDIKYKTQASLLRRMRLSGEPLSLDFRDAFAAARKLIVLNRG